MNNYEKLFKEHNLILKSDYKNSRTSVSLLNKSCGHKLNLLPEGIKFNINKNNGIFKCPECRLNEIRMDFMEVKKIVSDSTQKEYRVSSLKKDYLNTRSKIKIYHKTCGKETPITYKNFSLGKRCRHCAAKTTNSKASQLLKRLLTHINIEFEEEKVFEDCKNPMTGRNLPFDFFIPKLNLLIEIDGEQHFYSVNRFGGEKALKERKYRDFIKDKFTLTSNIKLIRVPLVDILTHKKMKYDDIKIIIFNLLNDISNKYY